MRLEELKQARDLIQQQFDNISNPNWIALQLEQLKAKHSVYTELINKLEQEQQNATSSEKRSPKRSDRNND